MGAAEAPTLLTHGCGGPERPCPRGDALGHQEGFISGLGTLPRCTGGLFSGGSGSGSYSPTEWKRERVAEEKPSGHFVPESPKNSISARCQSKGWGHPPPRLSIRGPHSNGRRQRGAGGLPTGPLAVSRGLTWAGNRRKLLHFLRGRKARPPGFPLALSPV